ncbi:hypothetical protein QBC34DRAFT_27178 [Podospora aff. communis PSN243]|uniref:Uncharacterized protein n=1 Tax=Podospora aff. communis PSN243 TaxID=3040156 RepID=A0AAV9GW61_9PEZI|nr:hypothetical protein QBC34DRAFT_27178 [Podospora aff. communis PSN243]
MVGREVIHRHTGTHPMKPGSAWQYCRGGWPETWKAWSRHSSSSNPTRPPLERPARVAPLGIALHGKGIRSWRVWAERVTCRLSLLENMTAGGDGPLSLARSMTPTFTILQVIWVAHTAPVPADAVSSRSGRFSPCPEAALRRHQPRPRSLRLEAGTRPSCHLTSLASTRCVRACLHACQCCAREGLRSRVSPSETRHPLLEVKFSSRLLACWVACDIRLSDLADTAASNPCETTGWWLVGELRARIVADPMHCACPLPTWAGSRMSLIPSTDQIRTWQPLKKAKCAF